MKHYTLNLSPQQMAHLERIYFNHKTEVANEHLAFSAIHNDIRILAYKTGKVVIQGNEILHELSQIKTMLNIHDYEAIGSDEVGTGDVFGPVVVCSCYTSLEDLKFLEDLGVRDSKNMDDKKIRVLGPKLVDRLIYSLIILDLEKYNDIIKRGYNLNRIKAVLHNSAIIKTTSKINKKVSVILDQFCKPDLYFSYLKDEKFKYTEIEFQTQAEKYHISVAAASIIARYAFLIKMHELGKLVGFKLQKGASSLVDAQIKEIYENKGIDTLAKVAKMNYKNISKITTPVN